MKKIVATICLLPILLSNSIAQAQDYTKNSCFEGMAPIFQPTQLLPLTPQQKADALARTCLELDMAGMAKKKSLGDYAVETSNRFTFAILGHGIAAFATPDSTEFQRQYVETLEQIKQVENPMERIYLTYQLAARTQGFYDKKTLGLRTWSKGFGVMAESPSNLLNAVQDNGTVGVCREMASLLQWSLIQVARHPSSKSAGLTSKDFSSEFITGNVPGGGHAWVRVHIPQHDEDGLILGFVDFDLDTTWYPENFTTLLPRRSGISTEDRKALLNQCQAIRKCLMR